MTGKALKKIQPQDLVAMDEFCAGGPVRIDLSYAKGDNFLFGERVYHPGARLWLYRDLAALVRTAALICHKNHGFIYVLHDGLRTTDAQARMLGTKRVRENPGWLAAPMPLLSSPGQGGHPRGMAIDISLQTGDGESVHMGTVFDFLAQDPSPVANKAHRDHPHLTPEIKSNRVALDESMQAAAAQLNLPLFPLPQEWWDFRFPNDVYEAYAPLAEDDLPEHMRLLD
ncbi:MAG: M15 family metallopeptidase [Alphaproteobacteria bacterium]